jgi:mannose-6-phosphate isomerase-like protein (cupin superfamily)
MDERLDTGELLSVVRDWARHPQRWEPLLRCLDDQRWSALIHLEDAFDVWVLTWPVQTGTELHDHGLSAGAFEVVSGTLEELYVRRRLRRRQLRAGSSVAFPAGAVHDVRNAGMGGTHAVSLHAYSPPLTSMTFYERGSDGLTAVRSEPVVPPALVTLPANTAQLVGAAR